MLINLLTLLGIFSTIHSTIVENVLNKYCEMSCGENKHTMCERFGCPLALAGEGVEQCPLDKTHIELILHLHNYHRNQLALHGDPEFNLPPAANMQKIKWDDELATIAQCWANACKGKTHDTCRNSKRWVVGQNIACASSNKMKTILNLKRFNDSLWMWNKEREIFDSPIDKYEFVHETGHFTQLMWATSKWVGCGRTCYKLGNRFKLVFVCNYGESGNIVDRSIYEPGDSCTKCPENMKRDEKYTGLCS